MRKIVYPSNISFDNKSISFFRFFDLESFIIFIVIDVDSSRNLNFAFVPSAYFN